MRGELDLALSEFNESIQLDADAAATHAARGKVYFAQRDPQKALADFNKAVELAPDSAAVRGDRGVLKQVMRDNAGAVADLTEAAKLGPENAPSLNNLAWFLVTNPDERFRNSKVAVSAAAKANGLTGWNDDTCLDTFAAALAEAGDFDSAVKWQTKVVDLAPLEKRDRSSKRLDMYQRKEPVRQ